MDLHVFTILLPAALAQIQPDVRFDHQNDRFDLSSLMRQASYDQWGDIVDGSRRADGISINNDTDTTGNVTSKFMEALKVFQQNFQYNATGSGDESDPSEDPNNKSHLRRDLVAYLYDLQPSNTRRSGQIQKDREVLMHYAVPITIEVNGMMKAKGDE